MELRIDILDDRLEAIEAENERERVRLYFELWRKGAVDPLCDLGVVVIVTLDGGPRPSRVVVNDGQGYGDPALALAGSAPRGCYGPVRR
jgi:hypothetical protein